MSIAVVNNYCRKRLHVQEFSGKRYFDKEVEAFNGIPLKLFFSLNVYYLFTLHLDFLKFLAWYNYCFSGERRSKQQNGLKNF